MPYNYNPFTNNLDQTATGGGGSGIVTITGDSGSVTGATVQFTGASSGAVFTGIGSVMTESFNFLDMSTTDNVGDGVISLNGGIIAHWYTPAGMAFGTNIFMGDSAGNFTMTGGASGPSGNIGIGTNALKSITGDGLSGYIGIGYNAATNLSSAAGPSVVIGHNSAISATSLDYCTVIGPVVAASAATMIRCILIGGPFTAGNYTGGETDNVLIGNQGVANENNVMRLSKTGSGVSQVNKTFIGGITGSTPIDIDTPQVMTCDSNDNISVIDSLTTGFVLTSNGAASPTFKSLGFVVNVQTFTISGTYTPTAGMKYCMVEAVGGGGGASGSADLTASPGFVSVGSSGGGGGYCRKLFAAVAIGVSQAVTIGAGGVGTTGNAGATDGGATTFGALLTASGGIGGISTGGASSFVGFVIPSPGGTATGGDVNIVGQPSQYSVAYNFASTGPGTVIYSFAGSGGATPLGYGGVEKGATSPGNSAQNGANGVGFGSGGSGGASVSNPGFDVATTGGNGAPGAVIVTEYIFP